MKIWLDGKLVDEGEARISVFDHGLLYGDGIFEGIRFYNGRVFRLEEHIHRLYDSAKAILLNNPLFPLPPVRSPALSGASRRKQIPAMRLVKG